MTDVQATIDALRPSHRRRCFAMEQRKRADLALGAFIRRDLGWTKDAPAADRARINARAKALITLGESEAKYLTYLRDIKNGKKVRKMNPPDHVDEPDWLDLAPIIVAAIQSREPFDQIEHKATRDMEKLAETLPVWPLMEGVRGLGPRSLGTIIAEAGDLSLYPTHSHLWKRMGMAVIDGHRQGAPGKSATKADWIVEGYSPSRRSKMFVIGDALVKSNGDGRYRTIYLARKEYERERAEAAGLTVAPSAAIPKVRAAEFMSVGHIANRAQRYMEKRLLRDLWQAWRRASRVPPAHLNAA